MNSIRNFLLLLIVFGMTAVSCEESNFFPCLKPEGSETEEVRFTSDFHAINVSLYAKVFIREGAENSVTIVAAENLLEHIITHSNGTTLNVENSRCLRTKSDDVKIYITTPTISAIGLSGTGNVYVESPFSGPFLNLEISGSGNIHFPKLQYQKVDAFISGSGNMNYSGSCTDQFIRISGSGKINAFGMESAEAMVRVSGSGDAGIFVTEVLDAKITGSGNVLYLGNPTLKISISGTGTISHVDNDMIE